MSADAWLSSPLPSSSLSYSLLPSIYTSKAQVAAMTNPKMSDSELAALNAVSSILLMWAHR